MFNYFNYCVCKKDYFSFRKDNSYSYIIDSHHETGILIYLVNNSTNPDTGLKHSHPFVKLKFDEYFNDIQSLREEKLNKLLND